MRYKWGLGCCFQGLLFEHAQGPVPLLSFEAHATLLQWQACPHEADEDPEAPEKKGAGLSRSQGQGYHVPTLVLGFPPPPATSPAQGIPESIKDMVSATCISDLFCNLRPAPFPLGASVFSSCR